MRKREGGHLEKKNKTLFNYSFGSSQFYFIIFSKNLTLNRNLTFLNSKLNYSRKLLVTTAYYLYLMVKGYTRKKNLKI